MALEGMTETAADELAQGVETAKELFPGARVKVRRGRLIVLHEDLIIIEPFAWALQREALDSIE